MLNNINNINLASNILVIKEDCSLRCNIKSNINLIFLFPDKPECIKKVPVTLGVVTQRDAEVNYHINELLQHDFFAKESLSDLMLINMLKLFIHLPVISKMPLTYK